MANPHGQQNWQLRRSTACWKKCGPNQRVKSGHPALVGCAFDPKTSMLKDGHLQATRDGGHTVLIVSCNEAATEFLYVDPYPGGSTMKYKGGIAADSYPPKCLVFRPQT